MTKRSVVSVILGLMLLTGSISLAAPDAAPTTQPVVATKVATPVAPTATPTAEAVKVEETKPAVTETQDTQKWWQGVLVTVIEAAIAIVTPVLSVLIMLLIRKWKLKIEQDKVDWILSKAVGAGEQYVKGKLKDGKPVDGPEAARIALELGNKLLEQYKLPSKLGTYLSELIEAKLGEGVVDAGGARAVVNGEGTGG
jgi:hypothetical protein